MCIISNYKIMLRSQMKVRVQIATMEDDLIDVDFF